MVKPLILIPLSILLYARSEQVYILWIRVLQLLADDPGCSHTNLVHRERFCMDAFNLTGHVFSGIPNALFGNHLDQFCKHSSGVIPCLQEGFEPCDNPFYDFRSYNGTFTRVCANKMLYMYSELFCDETVTVLQTCSDDYKTNILRLKNTNDESQCLLRDCLHINENTKCKRRYSEFMTSLYQGRFSSETCDVYNTTTFEWSEYLNSTDHEKGLYRAIASSASVLKLESSLTTIASLLFLPGLLTYTVSVW